MITQFKNQTKKHKETIHNFTWRAIQLFGKQGVTIALFIICAKLLTPLDFGIYNYILAIILFLILFGDFGISAAASKYTTEFHQKGSKSLYQIAFNSIIVIALVTIIIFTIIIVFGQNLFKEKFQYILWAIPLIFLTPATSLYDGIYRGLKKFKELAIISSSIGIISITLSYFIIKEFGIIGALISENMFYLFLLITLIICNPKTHFTINKKIMRKIFFYAVIIGIGNLGFFLYSKINILILGHYGYIIEIGYYELANKVLLIIFIPFSILGQVIAPNITKLSIISKKEEIFKKYKKHIILIFILGIIIATSLFIIYPFALKLFLNKYAAPTSIKIFKLLMFIAPFSILASFISSAYIISTGNAKYNLLLLPFGLVNLVLASILTKNIGYLGVIYSMLICTTTYRITLFSLLYKKFKNESKKNNI